RGPSDTASRRRTAPRPADEPQREGRREPGRDSRAPTRSGARPLRDLLELDLRELGRKLQLLLHDASPVLETKQDDERAIRDPAASVGRISERKHRARARD